MRDGQILGTEVDNDEQDFYQTAFVLNIDRFSIGGVFEYFNDIEHIDQDFLGTESGNEHDAWVAGGGVAYNYNAWTFGAQYSYRDDDFDSFFDGDHDRQETVQQRAVVTVDYVLGPGINLDAELGYTWRDFDPEDENTFATDDDYDGLEIGLGSSLRF